jgi:hypothetical protein
MTTELLIDTDEAEGGLQVLFGEAAGFEDICDVHGEDCPVPNGGTCLHYQESYTFDDEGMAAECGRLAFIVGRVYEISGSTFTVWPFADRVPQR